MTLHLLTADIGAGKTTFCAALADHARTAGWDVAGILSPPVFENGVKTGILAQNLRTGETRTLAISSTQFPTPDHQLPLGNWLFSPSTLSWGNQTLTAALPCDLFIVDELGPLELLRNEGWIHALTALRQQTYKIGIAVVRPSLVQAARTLFPESQVFPLPHNAPEFFPFLPGT